MTRPPIITILGHVDHGKTTLLDALRHTNVAASESGGITQHIGAYQITYQNQLLTFIDTPGHAAFSAMRSRGGRVADLAVLVIAADDGVKPQTQESLEHIKAANIPFLVAITKIDLEQSEPQKVKTQLAEHGVSVEGFGGNTPVVEVSAKQGTNLNQLLDTLLLMSQIQEPKADPQGVLEAIVIESSLDKHKGPLATLLVKSGTLRLTDHLVAITDLDDQSKNITGKARQLTDWQNQSLQQALPSTPVQVLGFTTPPPVGSLVTHPQTITQVTSNPLLVDRPQATVSQDAFKIILKADVTGTLEAIINSLPTDIELIAADSGPINESDVLHAQTTGSTLIGFRVQPTPAAQRLATIDHVDVFTYQTIYDLLEALPQLIETAHQRASYELELAKVQVLKIFDLAGIKIIGATVLSGSVSVGDQLRLLKNDQLATTAKVASLRTGRLTIDKVKKGEEFGLITEPVLDIAPKDHLLAFKVVSRNQV